MRKACTYPLKISPTRSYFKDLLKSCQKTTKNMSSTEWVLGQEEIPVCNSAMACTVMLGCYGLHVRKHLSIGNVDLGVGRSDAHDQLQEGVEQ